MEPTRDEHADCDPYGDERARLERHLADLEQTLNRERAEREQAAQEAVSCRRERDAYRNAYHEARAAVDGLRYVVHEQAMIGVHEALVAKIDTEADRALARCGRHLDAILDSSTAG